MSGLDKMVFPVGNTGGAVSSFSPRPGFCSQRTLNYAALFFCPTLAFSVGLFFFLLRDYIIGMALLTRLQINLLWSNILKGFGLAESRLTYRPDSGPENWTGAGAQE